MAILNKKYTITEMKKLSKADNGEMHYFSQEMKDYFGTEKIVCYKHSLFIHKVDNSDRNKKVYDVKIFIYNEKTGRTLVYHLNNKSFETMDEARKMVRKIQKFFRKGLNNETKEIIENLCWVNAFTNGNIEFIKYREGDEPNKRFTVEFKDEDYKIIN